MFIFNKNYKIQNISINSLKKLYNLNKYNNKKFKNNVLIYYIVKIQSIYLEKETILVKKLKNKLDYK